MRKSAENGMQNTASVWLAVNETRFQIAKNALNVLKRRH